MRIFPCAHELVYTVYMNANSTAARISVAGRRLLDKEGAEAVSMRRVARAVGITAMAIYRHYLNHQISGGRTAGLEVPWVAASAFSRLEEHELEEPRVLESMLHIDLRHLGEPCFDRSGKTFARQPGS